MTETTTAHDMLTRHVARELARASEEAATLIDRMVTALTDAKRELAKHPDSAPDVALRLGGDHAMLNHALATLAARTAAAETLRLAAELA
jgi:hypothetical protein